MLLGIWCMKINLLPGHRIITCRTVPRAVHLSPPPPPACEPKRRTARAAIRRGTQPIPGIHITVNPVGEATEGRATLLAKRRPNRAVDMLTLGRPAWVECMGSASPRVSQNPKRFGHSSIPEMPDRESASPPSSTLVTKPYMSPT